MATSTQERDRLRHLRQRLEAPGQDADDTHALLVQVTDRFLTAAEYRDEALMRSALEEAKAKLATGVADKVGELISGSSVARVSIRAFTTDFEGVPLKLDDQLDALGRSLSAFVLSWLRHLTGFRDGPLAMAHKHGMEVPNAAELDEHIAHWQAVKANLVDPWPWTDSPLPPVDRGMVARSRAAFLAGNHGEDIDTLIERLRSE